MLLSCLEGEQSWVGIGVVGSGGMRGGQTAVGLAILRDGQRGQDTHGDSQAYLLATAVTPSLHTVAALDDIGLEGDGPRAAMELQEEATGIAQD